MRENITDYERAKTLLTAALRPGVLTNRPLTAQELRRETENGTLWVQRFPGGLYLLRERPTHAVLTFYLDSGATPVPPAWPGALSLEIPARLRDSALRGTLPLWQSLGFTPTLQRLRMTRPGGKTTEAPLPLADLTQAGEIAALLRESFDPLTACLPPLETLEEEISMGLVLYDGDAVLRWAEGAARELRHLAVRPTKRGQGAGTRLVNTFLNRLGDKRCLVWTGQGNAIAQQLYRRAGFQPDGYTSYVLLYTKG